MTTGSPDAIDRREALRRAALVLGGVLSAPMVAGVLAGCDARRTPAEAWQPRALTLDQADLVAAVVDQIIPETDTPGARAVGVHRFIDAMLADSYADPERERFVAGLGDLDRRARSTHGRTFRECTPAEQLALLETLDGAADPAFRTLKALTLVGYYTSEVGATRELRHVAVPGRFEGCVPVGRTWAV